MSEDEQLKFINTIEHDNVVDIDAYRSWRKCLIHPILNERRRVETSDGKEVDLARLKLDLEKLISHLPEKEVKQIMQLKSIYSKVMGRANTFKRQAFKINPHNGFVGTMTSILDSRKDELIELFGRMFSSKEVLDIINKEWKMKTSMDTVLSFKRQNAQLIAIKIEEFKKSFGDIRLYNKTSRLEELVWLYGNLKSKYENFKGRDDYNLLLKTLEQIRKESEGEQLHINGTVDLKIETNIQHHIQRELLKTIPLKEIIIGRIASKTNISPAAFIKSLNDSYYSKFTKFLDGEATDADFESSFPSTLTYDFDNIDKIQESRTKDRENEKEKYKIQSQNNEEVNVFKELLLAKLAEKKADNVKSKLESQIQAEIGQNRLEKKRKNK